MASMLINIRAFAVGLLLAAFAAGPACAQGTARPKTTLNSEVSQQYPDNTSGLIFPSNARTVTNDLIASFQQAPQVNLQTGVSYTIAASDYGQVVRFNNSNPIAVTLPAATGSFAVFSVYINSTGTGTVTITPTSGTIDGTSNFTVTQNQTILVVSDGTNWQVALRGVTGVSSIGGTSGPYNLNGDLAVIAGTTSTNGPYTAGATTITVTSLKGMSVGQAITLHFDDTTTSNVTVTALGNSQLGGTVSFTPAIPGGKTMSATDQVTWSQVLAFGGDYHPAYYPTAFGLLSAGHSVAWLDQDNFFNASEMALVSHDYSIGGNISTFTTAPANGDTTNVTIAGGSAIACQSAAVNAKTIFVVTGADLSGIVGTVITIHQHDASTQTVSVTAVVHETVAPTCTKSVSGDWSLTWTSGTGVAGGGLDAAALVDLQVSNFTPQPAYAAVTTGVNPSSVTVFSSIQIPTGDQIFIVLSDGTLLTTAVSSMTPNAGCTAGGQPCQWTLNFSPAVSGGQTILNSGGNLGRVFWRYSFTNTTVASSDTMASFLRKIANVINADAHIAASGSTAVLQGIGTSTGTLIVEPKRFYQQNAVPAVAIFPTPATGGHITATYTQPQIFLDNSAAFSMDRAASGYQPKAGDNLGNVTFGGFADDGVWQCCTVQYGAIYAFIVNPSNTSSLLGRLSFFTAGSQAAGINQRLDIVKGLTTYFDNGNSAEGGDQGAGSINIPSTSAYFVGGVAGVSCPSGVSGAATRVVKGIITVC
jgi:hypothetical protein